MLVWDHTPFPIPCGEDAGSERIAAFYRALEGEAEALAARITAHAFAEYTASAAPRKRLSFSFYRLETGAQVTEESGAFFSLARKTVLRRGSRLLATRRAYDLFFRRSGLLCTPAALRLLGYRVPRGKGELYCENGQLRRADEETGQSPL